VRNGNGYETDEEGRLVPMAEVELAFAEDSCKVSAEQVELEKGRGKRKKTANKLYSEDAFRWWKED